jgi:hypothetical protein
MVWIRWEDYGKKSKPKKQKKKKIKIEPRVKVIHGKHKVEFRKANELLDKKS